MCLLRGQDSNLRFPAYEADEMTSFSTPQYIRVSIANLPSLAAAPFYSRSVSTVGIAETIYWSF